MSPVRKDDVLISSSRRPSCYWSSCSIIYRALDYVIGLLVVSPCVIIGFRGLWVFEDSVVYTDNLGASCLVSFIAGHILIFIFYLLQDVLAPLARQPRKKPLFHLIAPLYKLLWSCAFINQWRCIWIAYDLWLDSSLGWSLKALSGSTLILVIFRSLPLVGSTAPHLFVRDTEPRDTFQCQPRYSTKLSKTPIRHLLDCVLSVFILQSMVVVFWKSVWTFWDARFGPPSFPVSSMSTLFVGLSMTLLSYAVQDTIHTFAFNLKSLPKIVFQNLWFFYCGLCCITTWHGLWVFMDGAIGVESANNICSFIITLYILSAFFDVSLFYTKSIIVENKSFKPKADVLLLKIRYFADIYQENMMNIAEIENDQETILLNNPLKAYALDNTAALEVKLQEKFGGLKYFLSTPETAV